MKRGFFKVISSPFTVKGNRRQKIKRLCNSSRRENLSVTTVIDNPSFLSENTLVPSSVPKVLPALMKTEPPMMIKTEKHGPGPQAAIFPIKQEPGTTSSKHHQFLNQSDNYRLYSTQNKRPKTEDILSPPHRQSYYLDSGGSIHRDIENIQAQYYPPPSTNAFNYPKGPYTPNDYSIPPDEEGDNYEDYSDLEDHQDHQDHQQPLVKVEPYPFNGLGIDKQYMFEGVNSMEYYYPRIDPRDEGRYGYTKRRCLEGNVFKNL